MNIKPNGIGNAISTLRGHLPGDESVLTFRQNVLSLNWERDNSDAAEFRRLTNEALDIRGESDFESLTPDKAREINSLTTEALSLWSGFPTTGLEEAVDRVIEPKYVNHEEALRYELTELSEIVSYWKFLFCEARILQADGRLALPGDRAAVKAAVGQLMTMAQEAEPPEALWPRLLAATSTAANDRLQQAWDLCVEAYERAEEELPKRLFKYEPTRHAPALSPVRASHPRGPVKTASDPRLELFDDLGIMRASTLHLRGSRLEPLDCIARTTVSLHSSGVLAGKWVTEPLAYRKLDELLYRLDDEGDPDSVDVKFLVINPDSEAFAELSEMRAGAPSVEPVNKLIALSKKYQCLQVRGFSHLPTVRYIAIDDDLVSFSPYAMEEEAYQVSRDGWDAPHVLLDPFARYPLASVFKSLFEQDWNAATPLLKAFDEQS